MVRYFCKNGITFRPILEQYEISWKSHTVHRQMNRCKMTKMSLIGCFIPNECHKNLLSQYQKYCDKDNDINVPSLDIGFSRKLRSSKIGLKVMPYLQRYLTMYHTLPYTKQNQPLMTLTKSNGFEIDACI